MAIYSENYLIEIFKINNKKNDKERKNTSNTNKLVIDKKDYNKALAGTKRYISKCPHIKQLTGSGYIKCFYNYEDNLNSKDDVVYIDKYSHTDLFSFDLDDYPELSEEKYEKVSNDIDDYCSNNNINTNITDKICLNCEWTGHSLDIYLLLNK